MPAYFTHYLFGRISRAGLREGRLKRLLLQYPEAYALGLAGPDIFFYFVPDQLLLKKTPGSILHEQGRYGQSERLKFLRYCIMYGTEQR